MDFTKESLWELRKEITLNSLFTNDFENSFGIPAKECQDFFDGYMKDLEDMAEDTNIEFGVFLDAFDLDSPDALWDYYNSVENAFGIEEGLKEEYNGEIVKVHVYDINWETDGEDIDLPKEVDLEIEHDQDLDIEEEIPEELSKEFGWLVNYYSYDLDDNQIKEDLTEEKVKGYTWKHIQPGSEDWALVKRGEEPKEDESNCLVILSRMNRFFPWSIYVKGEEDKNLEHEAPTDNLKDIKEFISANIDKILGEEKVEEGFKGPSFFDRSNFIIWVDENGSKTKVVKKDSILIPNALKEILAYIKELSKEERKKVGLDWKEVFDNGEEGDVIVSIYDPSESTTERSLSNASAYEKDILAALNENLEESIKEESAEVTLTEASKVNWSKALTKEKVKEDWDSASVLFDDIAADLAEKVNAKFPEAGITADDIQFDDSRAWSLFVDGHKLGLPVSKFGAFRNYLGGGVRGSLQHNGREKEGTIELGQAFADALAQLEAEINHEEDEEGNEISHEPWEQATGVLTEKKSFEDKVKRYTKEEALEIINNDEELKAELEEYKPLVGTEDLDYGFEHGNFFSFWDREADKLDPEKICIQWLDSDSEDEDNLEAHSHEVIADSIEEAIVILRDIEAANGNLTEDKKRVKNVKDLTKVNGTYSKELAAHIADINGAFNDDGCSLDCYKDLVKKIIESADDTEAKRGFLGSLEKQSSKYGILKLCTDAVLKANKDTQVVGKDWKK